jgi:hypothetical protein
MEMEGCEAERSLFALFALYALVVLGVLVVTASKYCNTGQQQSWARVPRGLVTSILEFKGEGLYSKSRFRRSKYIVLKIASTPSRRGLKVHITTLACQPHLTRFGNGSIQSIPAI